MRFCWIFLVCVWGWAQHPVSVYHMRMKPPAGTVAEHWGCSSIAWLADQKEGLFVSVCGSATCGHVSASLGYVELTPKSGSSVRCHIVYNDWFQGIAILKAYDEDLPLLQQETAAKITTRLCQENEKVRVVRQLDNLPFNWFWHMVEVADPWIANALTVQTFSLPANQDYIPGAPVVDAKGEVIGIVRDKSDNATLVIQARHIDYALEKWYNQTYKTLARGYVRSADGGDGCFESVSANGLVFVGWGVTTLHERLYFGQVNRNIMQGKYAKFDGASVQKQRHLCVSNVHVMQYDQACAPQVGDIIWAAWDGDQEVPIYGDPLALARLIDKAVLQGKDTVDWTVLRQGGGHRVRVRLVSSRPASEAFFIGPWLFTNEVVPNARGVLFCLYENSEPLTGFVQSIDGRDVHTLDDVREAFKASKEDHIVALYGAYHDNHASIMTQYMNPRSDSDYLYILSSAARRPRYYKVLDGLWHAQ